MNTNLSDPLDKVSVSVRKAVTINRCKEDDLRSVVGHISKEKKRSLNIWSSKQEQFLRTQKKILPAIKLPKSPSLTQQTFNRNISGLSDVNTRKLSRTSLPPIDDIPLRRSISEPTKGQSNTEDALMPPSTSLGLKRISLDERNPVVCVQVPTDKESSWSYLHTDEELTPRNLDPLSSQRGEVSPSSTPRRRLSPSSSGVNTPRRKLSPTPGVDSNFPNRKLSSSSPGIETTLPRRKLSSSPGVDSSQNGPPKSKANLLSVHFVSEGTLLDKNTAISMPDLNKIGENSSDASTAQEEENNSSVKLEKMSSWTRLRDSLGMFLLDPLGFHKRAHSTPDLKVALENMKECRYLRVPEKITAHNIENSKRCRCVTCCSVRKTERQENT